MIQIKKTKTVEMLGNQTGVFIRIGNQDFAIPMKQVFQVKRGLESYVQKFYRKHDKKSA
jgi:hypothetical protein